MEFKVYSLATIKEQSTYEGCNIILPTDVKYDLTNAKVRMWFIRPGKQTDPVKYDSEDGSLVITLPYSITIPEHKITMGPGKWVTDVKIVFGNNKEKTYFGLEWIIEPIISK